MEFWTAHDKVPHDSLLLKLKAAGAQNRRGEKIKNTAEKQCHAVEKC